MLAVLANASLNDVLIAYVPVILAILAVGGSLKRHLKKQDKTAEKVKSDLDSFNGETHDKLSDVQKELEYIKKQMNGEGFNEKTGYKV